MDPQVQADFMATSNEVAGHVQTGMVADLNDQGFQRGGKPIAEGDFWDVRNASSTGKVGMDRDLALNQQMQVKLQGALDNAVPGSRDAQSIANQLADLRVQTQITRVDPVTGAVVNVSPGEFRTAAQSAYNNNYTQVTGHSADDALHGITDWSHPEAYHDTSVLVNRPDLQPFSPTWADQTGSVTSQKMNDLMTKVANGEMSFSDAITESARGTAKDIATKLEPMLAANNATPTVIQNASDMQQFLADVGSGAIPPMQAQSMSQNLFGTDIQGLVGRVDASIASSAKFGARPPDWSSQAMGGLASSTITVGTAVRDQTRGT
jgi:hypothetical protein